MLLMLANSVEMSAALDSAAKLGIGTGVSSFGQS